LSVALVRFQRRSRKNRFYRIKPEHFRAEIGYMLLPAFSVMDISAINEVMNYGFNEMHLHSVEAIIDPNN
jgi:ribosomal-protein-alanine N-acetyltransferase